jgi:uncharacterized protein (DUF433 family)/DNA-binding transcriptional MerR regulator
MYFLWRKKMEYLGKGIYTIKEASKILKINPQKMRRWIKGYTYYKDTNEYTSLPLFHTEFKYDSADVVISFLDLAELLFINTFLECGVSIHTIRKAALAASELLQISHPFAIKKIYTDGKSIFAKIAEEDKDTSLIDLINKQFQLDKIVEPLLYERIDFNTYDHAERWWPLGRENNIVVDPSRNLGQPILNNYNIRTELIYELYTNNHSIDEISEWYEIDTNSIHNAIDFEQGLVA